MLASAVAPRRDCGDLAAGEHGWALLGALGEGFGPALVSMPGSRQTSTAQPRHRLIRGLRRNWSHDRVPRGSSRFRAAFASFSPRCHDGGEDLGAEPARGAVPQSASSVEMPGGRLAALSPALAHRGAARRGFASAFVAHASLADDELLGAAPAEIGVHALEDDGRHMLDLEPVSRPRHGSPRWRPSRSSILASLRAARPFERDRLADAGEPLADDLRPGEHDIGGREAARRERLAERGCDEVGKRPADLARRRTPGCLGQGARLRLRGFARSRRGTAGAVPRQSRAPRPFRRSTAQADREDRWRASPTRPPIASDAKWPPKAMRSAATATVTRLAADKREGAPRRGQERGRREEPGRARDLARGEGAVRLAGAVEGIPRPESACASEFDDLRGARPMRDFLQHAIDEEARPEREAQRQEEDAPSGQRSPLVRRGLRFPRSQARTAERQHDDRQVVAEIAQQDQRSVEASAEAAALAPA